MFLLRVWYALSSPSFMNMFYTISQNHTGLLRNLVGPFMGLPTPTSSTAQESPDKWPSLQASQDRDTSGGMDFSTIGDFLSGGLGDSASGSASGTWTSLSPTSTLFQGAARQPLTAAIHPYENSVSFLIILGVISADNLHLYSLSGHLYHHQQHHSEELVVLGL